MFSGKPPFFLFGQQIEKNAMHFLVENVVQDEAEASSPEEEEDKHYIHVFIIFYFLFLRDLQIWCVKRYLSASETFFPKQVYLYGVLAPFKGLCPWAAWFCLCLWACVPLWVLWAAWFYILHLSLVSHLSPTCLPLVSHLSPTCLPLVSHLSPTCLPLVSHLSPTCLPLWVLWAAWFYTCLQHVSHTCLPLWVLWAAWFYTCLPHVSHTCLPLWVLWAVWFYTCLPLVSHSGCSGPHVFFPLSPSCLHLFPTLGCHSECSGPHDFTLVSHSGWSGPRDFTLVCRLFSRLTQNMLLLDLCQLPCLAAALNSFTYVWGQRWYNFDKQKSILISDFSKHVIHQHNLKVMNQTGCLTGNSNPQKATMKTFHNKLQMDPIT